MPLRNFFRRNVLSVRALSVGLAVSFLLLLVLTACHRNPDPSTLSGVAPAAITDPDGYVGNSACATCHPGEFQQHRGSRHALTMHAADTASLGSLAPAPGAIPLAGYALSIEAGRLALTRSIAPVGPMPLDIALGSGKVGITFISLQGKDTLLEARMSYFPEGRQWDFTPGQEVKNGEDTVFGRIHHGNEDAGRCLRCHSVTQPPNDIKPKPEFYGVGCEVVSWRGQSPC